MRLVIATAIADTDTSTVCLGAPPEWQCDSLFADYDNGAVGILVAPIEPGDEAGRRRCPNPARWRLTFDARDIRVSHNLVGLKCDECKQFMDGAYIAARRL